MGPSLFSLFRSSSKTPDAVDETTGLARMRELLAAQEPPLTVAEQRWVTDGCKLRFLRARKLVVEDAYEMLQGALEWRKTYGVSELMKASAKHEGALKQEAATGKMYVLPKPDVFGRAVIVMRPGLENSSDPVENVRFLVYTLEQASKIAGDSKFVILIDYFTGNFSIRNAPSLSVMRQTLDILQNHYPERLGAALMFEAPTFFHSLYRVIRPLMDPVTREKIQFVTREDVHSNLICEKTLDWDTIPLEYGGNFKYVFDLNTYFTK